MSDVDDLAAKVTALLADDNPLAKTLGGIFALTVAFLDQRELAEDEAEVFERRHPDLADDLYHAASLLAPTMEVMSTGFVYRSHIRELLQRVVDGGDTREPTNAEVAAACRDTSLVGPLTTAGIVVYDRAFRTAFPDQAAALDTKVIDIGAYEQVAGGAADGLERRLRRDLTVKTRTLQGLTCPGRHHGEPTPDCKYFTPEQLTFTVE